MKHEYVEKLCNEFILDKGEELISQELTLAIRSVEDGAIVAVRDASDAHGVLVHRIHAFKTDSFNDALSLFEKLGYNIVSSSVFTANVPIIKEKKDEPKELEAKVEVSQKKFRKLQHKLLGKYRDFISEKNFIYDTEDNKDLIGELEEKGSLLRIRVETEASEERFWLTYKGEMEDSDLNKRVEINLPINTYSGAAYLLSMLGYNMVGGYHKKRYVHDLGDTKVFLDKACKCEEVFINGKSYWENESCMPPPDKWRTFVEVEGPSEKAIKNTLRLKLGILRYKNIDKSYIEIL